MTLIASTSNCSYWILLNRFEQCMLLNRKLHGKKNEWYLEKEDRKTTISTAVGYYLDEIRTFCILES